MNDPDNRQRVRIVREGAVRSIVLTRPEKRNALDGTMLTALLEAFQAPPAAEERVIVLRAEGPVFCAGIDLAERQRQQAARGASPIEPVLHAMEQQPLPIVGVVAGDAIAGGNELALHCDLVVAASTARFGMSLAQLGLAPTWSLAQKIVEAAGPVAAREILLLGDPLPAERMHALGIISFVAAPDNLDMAASRVVDRLAANAPLSLKAIKAVLVRHMRFRDGIEHADIDDLVQQARESADAREGIAARLEKRAARFTGQ